MANVYVYSVVAIAADILPNCWIYSGEVYSCSMFGESSQKGDLSLWLTIRQMQEDVLKHISEW